MAGVPDNSVDEEGQVWRDSYDTPCAYCRQTPCYTLLMGLAACNRCVEAWNGTQAEQQRMRNSLRSDYSM